MVHPAVPHRVYFITGKKGVLPATACAQHTSPSMELISTTEDHIQSDIMHVFPKFYRIYSIQL